ncbi:MAG: MBL fold metallo-hydrolase [Deltaproteobacteria bacterium]|nr:MBL fold metallo-hydrolase [Deltaproteobacteria bacterium]
MMTFFMLSCGAKLYHNPSKPHHTENGFKNNYIPDRIPSIMKWWWQRLTQDLPHEGEPDEVVQLVKSDIERIKNNRTEALLTWVGHATLLLQINGLNIITDPMFSERASPFSFLGPKRILPPSLVIPDLPQVDVVVISHNHYDHLDLDSVKDLNRQKGGAPLFLVPLGLKTWFLDQGINNVIEFDWWDAYEYRGLKFYFVPAQHQSMRMAFLLDRNQTLWGGWVVQSGDYKFYFAGDSGYSKDFQDIGERLGPIDLAAIPIDAYEPRWFMKDWHVNPHEAVQAHRDLKAKVSLAIHWGAFELSDVKFGLPPKILKEVMNKEHIDPSEFLVINQGVSLELNSLRLKR